MNIPSVYFEIARHFTADKKGVRQNLGGVHIRVDEGIIEATSGYIAVRIPFKARDYGFANNVLYLLPPTGKLGEFCRIENDALICFNSASSEVARYKLDALDLTQWPYPDMGYLVRAVDADMDAEDARTRTIGLSSELLGRIAKAFGKRPMLFKVPSDDGRPVQIVCHIAEIDTDAVAYLMPYRLGDGK